MRQRSSLMLAAALGVALMLVPILNACFPDDETFHRLASPAALLLWPGNAMLQPLQSAPDMPEVVFVNWLLYTAVLWPVLATFRRKRSV